MTVPRGPTCVPQFLWSGVRAIEITTKPAVNSRSIFDFSGRKTISATNGVHGGRIIEASLTDASSDHHEQLNTEQEGHPHVARGLWEASVPQQRQRHDPECEQGRDGHHVDQVREICEEHQRQRAG